MDGWAFLARCRHWALRRRMGDGWAFRHRTLALLLCWWMGWHLGRARESRRASHWHWAF
jgi:hypothetical protein